MSATNTRLIPSEREERLVHAMHALGDTTRYKLFKLLLADEKLCVSEIAERLDVSTPAVSQHFKTFELVGLVSKERNGQKICYMVKDNDELVKKIIKILSN